MVMRGKVEKSVKSIITVAALVLSCRLALGDSISNLSQIVGRDITQEVHRRVFDNVSIGRCAHE
jgi:hypothetical protein